MILGSNEENLKYRFARLATQQYFAMMHSDMQGYGVDMYMQLCVCVS